MNRQKHTVAWIAAIAAVVAAVAGAVAGPVTTAVLQQGSQTAPIIDPPASAIQSPVAVIPQPAPSDETNNSGASGAPDLDAPVWLADIEPITDVGLWISTVAVVRGQSYAHALATSRVGVSGPSTSAQFALNSEFKQLTGMLGLEDGGHASGKATFEIIVDGMVTQQVELAIGSEPIQVDLPLAGAQDLVLRVTDTSQSAYWADPVFLDLQLT